jgi:hypothetical protein
VLTEAITMYELDHRVVVESFLTEQGWRVEATATAITGQRPDGSAVRVTFDDHGRMNNVAVNIQGGTPG